MTPLQRVRAFCLECVGNSPKEVKLCPSQNCPLHPLRFGTDPNRKKREYSEEQLAAMRERLSKAREHRKNP